MGVYFPQSTTILRVRWESVNSSNQSFEEISDLPILCKSVRVNINDYTQADTFEIEVDYKNFPFDPRCIRAVAVTIAMEDAKKVFTDDNSLKYITPRINGSNPNVIFIGFADEERINFDDTKRTVRLEGRDYTALLIDKKYTKGAIGLEKPVDQVLSDILSETKETAEIKLDNQVQGELPVLSKFWGEKDLLSGKRSMKKDETYWDVIQDIVRRAGLIAYIQLDQLVISKPRNIYDKTKANKFVYGKNILNLEFHRKIGRRRGFNLIVRSLNLNTKEVLEAKIPAEATQAWSDATGISNTEVKLKKVKADGTAGIKEDEEVAPYMSFLVADVSDKDHLVAIGEQLYEEIGRQEIEGNLTTAEMATANGLNQEFNILQCRNGTPIQIFLEQGDMKVLSDSNKTKDQVAKYLIARGWPSKVASTFALKYNEFANIFYTKAVEFTLDNDQGFKCKIDFVNFIETKAGQK